MRWLPGIILALAAVALVFAWGEVPGRWVIHWAVGGHPNGWATKSLLGVFGPLFLGAFLWISIEALLLLVGRHASGRAAAASMSEALIFTEIALALTFAIVAIWLPLGRPESPAGVVVVALVVTGAGVIASMVRFAQMRPPVEHSKGDDGWRGLVYRNPKDERLWVVKRDGLRWTLNFAHRMAWPMLLLLVSPAVISVVAALVIAAHAGHAAP
jgi:uncharacterized membrane protein